MSARAIAILRKPALHFALLGALLFAGDRLRAARTGETPVGPPRERAPIVLGVERVRALVDDFVRETGAQPTSDQKKALVDQAIDDELLYREALVLGLDRNDKSVRARLVDKMRAVSEGPSRDEETLYREALAAGLDDDVVIKRILRENMRILLRRDPGEAAPTDEELSAYLSAHEAEYRQPETVSFDHVFLSARRHGSRLASDAASLRARLVRERVEPANASSLSDPFPLGLSVPARPESAVARQFGPGIADVARSGRTGMWSPPVASPYGLHLVWVRDRTAATVPPLSVLRQKLMVGFADDRASVRLRRALDRLRALYTVRVEGPS